MTTPPSERSLFGIALQIFAVVALFASISNFFTSLELREDVRRDQKILSELESTPSHEINKSDIAREMHAIELASAKSKLAEDKMQSAEDWDRALLFLIATLGLWWGGSVIAYLSRIAYQMSLTVSSAIPAKPTKTKEELEKLIGAPAPPPYQL